ncbi:response regulator [Nocardioides sp. TRM66260-LWL]|uniref:PAS domain-containing hybrid sensor histidine kinase/response regulator n=1 Tax=Nocardioides sp. TRM66260-LWL TaxID=2874478 RepID=UPI001CC3C30C|nr:PAS domain-containing hybrid sensor histidine kinase/response regulator [Nocardioides sp. TRM66260-LWL]MBZ5734714.1 response regulator [Nocardioides sp. TRM66260-LWL]
MTAAHPPVPGLADWLLDACPDGLWLLDDEGRTRWANAAMARLLGRSADELAGLPAAEVLDARGRGRLARLLPLLRGDDAPPADNAECLLVRPDGSTLWTLVTRRPLPAAATEAGWGRWLHRFTPYDEQHRARAQLAQAQQIARLGSWSWDLRTGAQRWSEEMHRLFLVGPDDDEVTLDDLLHRFDPDDHDDVRAAVMPVVRGERSTFSFEARTSPGSPAAVVRGMGRVEERDENGEPLVITGTTQDITALREALEASADALWGMEMLQGIASAANQAGDLVEAVRLVTERISAATDWQPVALHAIDPRPAGADGADGADAAEPRVVERLSFPGPVRPDPALTLRAAAVGQPCDRVEDTPAGPRALVAMPVLAEGGTVAVVQMLADRPDVVASARRLLGHGTAQLSVVAERERMAATLAVARDRAEEASRLKSEFLATMSHEIRTPLNGVIGLNEVLLRSGLDARRRGLAEGVRDAGRSLLAIVDDILDLSKIEAGHLGLEDGDVDVRAVVERAASLVGPAAAQRSLPIRLEVDPLVPARVRGDATRLGQIASNLLGNAVKFTDRGEVRVRVAVVPPAGEHADPGEHGGGSAPGARLRISVTDTGPGLSPEALARVFEPFTQADASATRRHGGTGLGLTISRRLADAMGGTLTGSSCPGEGSTFVLELPLRAAGPIASPPAAPEAPGAPPRGRRVLVVEDSPVNQEVAVGLLEALGCVVELADDGAAALERLAPGHDVDLVLMDLRMPGIDGLDVTRRLRAAEQDHGLGRVPIVAVTASALADDRAHCLAAGMDDFLTKPIDVRALSATLTRWLGPADAATGPTAPPAPPEPAEPAVDPAAESVLDPERVADLRSLVKDGVDFFERTARSYLERLPDEVGSVEAAVAACESARLRDAAHRARGAAVNVGLPALGRVLGDLEACGRQETWAPVVTLMAALRVESTRARLALEAALR